MPDSASGMSIYAMALLAQFCLGGRGGKTDVTTAEESFPRRIDTFPLHIEQSVLTVHPILRNVHLDLIDPGIVTRRNNHLGHRQRFQYAPAQRLRGWIELFLAI